MGMMPVLQPGVETMGQVTDLGQHRPNAVTNPTDLALYSSQSAGVSTPWGDSGIQANPASFNPPLLEMPGGSRRAVAKAQPFLDHPSPHFLYGLHPLLDGSGKCGLWQDGCVPGPTTPGR